jgi:segregation and condensation protein A
VEHQESDQQYVVKLDVFEGPLDLLLHLITKHEIDVFDIPISFITKEYLKYLDMMRVMNLDMAAGYLEMAATLALIKSKTLVPNDPAGDAEELEPGPDPREELVKRLLEYQKYKTAAEELAARPMLGRDTFARGMNEDFSGDDRGLSSPGLFALIEAFQKMISHAKIEKAHEVTIARISISDRINQIVDLLRIRRRITFMELFEGRQTKGQMVVTFIAMLEMAKLGLSRIHQAGVEGEIYISATETVDDSIEELTKNLEEDE